MKTHKWADLWRRMSPEAQREVKERVERESVGVSVAEPSEGDQAPEQSADAPETSRA